MGKFGATKIKMGGNNPDEFAHKILSKPDLRSAQVSVQEVVDAKMTDLDRKDWEISKREQAKKQIQQAFRFMLPLVAAAKYWELHNTNTEFELRKNDQDPFAHEFARRGIPNPFARHGLSYQDEALLFGFRVLFEEGLWRLKGDQDGGTKFILRAIQLEKWKYEENQFNLRIGRYYADPM